MRLHQVFLFSSVLTLPNLDSQQPLTGLKLRLISSSEGQSEWMTEGQIFQLYKEGVKFIDVTDGDWQTLNLYNKLNTAQAHKFPISLFHQDKVNSFIESISKERMTNFLTEFSSFHTRYYKSKWGKESSQFLFDHLSSIKSSNSTKITVEKVKHTWDQFSIIARFEKIGNTVEDRVILSAHQDSVNQWNPWFGRSPGADDDGSGTTTILEAFHVLAESDFIPERPIEFHFYSAEEGGLLGSQKVVAKYLKEGKKVFGVFHNDMTGYAPKGKTPVIGLSIEDTNQDLTAFLRVLSDGYSGIKWLNTKCGYACSDHASWTKGGFAAAFTFESAFDDQSPYIHSPNDTVENLSFDHMISFVKNAIGYAVEMSLFE